MRSPNDLRVGVLNRCRGRYLLFYLFYAVATSHTVNRIIAP